jgi:hypothetical protein
MPSPASFAALLPGRALLLALLLGLAFVPAVADEPNPPAGEEEEPGGDEGGAAGEEDEPLDDGADVQVSFADEINKALDLGVKWLLAKPSLFGTRRADMAHWGLVKGSQIYGGGDGPQYRHPAGPTALALYTLLKCGVDPKHPVIVQGFNWLRETHAITEQYDGTSEALGWEWSHRVGRGSYELSVQILALTAKYDQFKRTRNTAAARRRGKLSIRDKDDKEWLQELVAALVEQRGVPVEEPPEAERLGWRYNLRKIVLSSGRSTQTFSSQPGHIANQDLSSTQLAALALFSAHQFGVEADAAVWADIVEFTLSHQEEDGPEHKRHDPAYSSGGYGTPTDRARGFMYIKGSPDRSEGKATGSMTACGIANLLIAKDVMLSDRKGRKLWEEHKLDHRVEKAIWDGLAWLDLNWSAFENPRSAYGYHIYYLYCVERAMDILGKQLVGKHVWYQEGARSILDRQKPARVKDPLDPRAPEVDVTYWETGATHEPKDVLDTCFALLFLKRATKDIVPGGVPITGGDGAPVDNR